jgi:hypothetical protein
LKIETYMVLYLERILSILRSLQGFRTFCDGPIKEAKCEDIWLT